MHEPYRNWACAALDVGLEMSGSPAGFREMIASMYNGSKISLLGILPNNTRSGLERDHLQGAHPEGYLWQRDVGDAGIRWSR